MIFNLQLRKYSPNLTKDLKLPTRKFFLTSDLSGFRRQAIKFYVLKLFSIPALTKTLVIFEKLNLFIADSILIQTFKICFSALAVF